MMMSTTNQTHIQSVRFKRISEHSTLHFNRIQIQIPTNLSLLHVECNRCVTPFWNFGSDDLAHRPGQISIETAGNAYSNTWTNYYLEYISENRPRENVSNRSKKKLILA